MSGFIDGCLWTGAYGTVLMGAGEVTTGAYLIISRTALDVFNRLGAYLKVQNRWDADWSNGAKKKGWEMLTDGAPKLLIGVVAVAALVNLASAAPPAILISGVKLMISPLGL